MDKQKKILEKVYDIFSRFNHRTDIEIELLDANFKLWDESMQYEDEQIWYYDDGSTPNMDVLLLINWIDAFCWVFKKDKKIQL